jgi:hypothetical protein
MRRKRGYRCSTIRRDTMNSWSRAMLSLPFHLLVGPACIEIVDWTVVIDRFGRDGSTYCRDSRSGGLSMASISSFSLSDEYLVVFLYLLVLQAVSSLAFTQTQRTSSLVVSVSLASAIYPMYSISTSKSDSACTALPVFPCTSPATPPHSKLSHSSTPPLVLLLLERVQWP